MLTNRIRNCYMIKELHGGIGKKKGLATLMTQVACPFSSVYSIKTNKCPFEEMGPTLDQEKRNDYGNTANYCNEANRLINGFLFEVLLINFPSIKSSKKIEIIPILLGPVPIFYKVGRKKFKKKKNRGKTLLLFPALYRLLNYYLFPHVHHGWPGRFSQNLSKNRPNQSGFF